MFSESLVASTDVIHTVKGFGIVNEAEVDLFLELSCFFDDPMDVGNLTTLPASCEICMQVKMQQNWTWNSRQVQNRERSTSRLYTVTLLIYAEYIM